MRSLFTFALILCSTLFMGAQEQFDIRILSLMMEEESIQMNYEEVSLSGASIQDSKSGFSSTPTLALPKNLVVYIYNPRLGIIRTHIRDLTRQGPSMWRDRFFRVHTEESRVVKLEEIIIIE